MSDFKLELIKQGVVLDNITEEMYLSEDTNLSEDADLSEKYDELERKWKKYTQIIIIAQIRIVLIA